MPKIAIIGSGSLVFTRNLCSDMLLAPCLRRCTISLMDVDSQRLEQSRQIVQCIAERRKLPAKIEATTDRKDAIRDADYVITTFQQGGLEAYKTDIEIPQRYGVEQCVGDTLGPGGVFRALRTIPVLVDLCLELDDFAPDALLLNYVNPMAANCWAIDVATGRPQVGLCHSVQGTGEMLANWINVPYNEITFFCAGINHQSFFLEFRRGKTDLYPMIWEAAERPENYAKEPVRIDLMKYLGFFVTESSGHASEYVPYFRKSAAMVKDELVPKFSDEINAWFDYGRTGGYLRHCLDRLQKFQREFEEILAQGPATTRSHEYGSFIIEAMESHSPICINGNIPNTGLIDNLPEDCCVEVPCLVDGNGVQPTKVGSLPPQLAALNRTNINVQELIVEAALNGRTESIYHALMLDPLTAAVCTLPQIRSMVDEMLEAQRQWLPQF
ncbi:MAG: alpha-glucosidase/alpha-galactosidase [Verrucomicrobia bacterium]|nr:alpha-glucosidase/alpha-galactosidase [Verrucomicrobiota bacterium]MBV9129651.1 alpha-glucosidase/alpha-galactosidase [Verrucomicrobiota bacterium]MBV9643285.1 alpha-glucosidase/alpha-galactosidase [Verrucomicrobiota bacterium]